MCPVLVWHASTCIIVHLPHHPVRVVESKYASASPCFPDVATPWLVLTCMHIVSMNHESCACCPGRGRRAAGGGDIVRRREPPPPHICMGCCALITDLRGACEPRRRSLQSQHPNSGVAGHLCTDWEGLYVTKCTREQLPCDVRTRWEDDVTEPRL